MADQQQPPEDKRDEMEPQMEEEGAAEQQVPPPATPASEHIESSGSFPTITVSSTDEVRSRKKKKKKKGRDESHTETETDDEDEEEDVEEEETTSSGEDEEEEESPKVATKKTRFDVPKKTKKKSKGGLMPRRSEDVTMRRSADWRGAPRASIDYFADIRNNPPRYSVDLRHSEDRQRYSEIAGDAFMRRRSFGTRGTALTFEPLGSDDTDEGRRSRDMPALFGIRPSWSGRDSVDRRRFAKQLDEDLHKPHPHAGTNVLALIGNVIYAVLVGWIVAGAYMLASGLLWLSQVGKPYAHLCRRLAGYYLWPFGKYLTRPAGYGAMSRSQKDDTLPAAEPFTENSALLTSQSKRSPIMAEEGYVDELFDDLQYKSSTSGWIAWCIVAPFLTVIHAIVAALCWIIVVSIPMSKVHQVGIKMAWHDPLAVRITTSAKMDGEIELSTEQAFSLSYISYQAIGVNVCLLNMTPCILIVVLFEFLIPHEYHPPSVIFAFMCLFGIVPLAYIIGTAVGSIALQTNFTVGAMLNAIFGVSIEIILYSSAIRRGGLETLVQAGVIGSVLGDLLLIPGLSMLAGGIKYKEQRFSPAVAGVSSVLLVISVIGAFTPTIVWLVYGEYHFTCGSCNFFNGTEACSNCDFVRVTDYDSSPVYIHAVRPLMYACSVILPFAYLVGLLFTLKTHSYIFENVEPDEQDAPRWSIRKSSIILGFGIALFAIVAEGLVAVLEPALHDLGINQTFAGLTVMALVPSSAEYVNAIQFAMNNQIALSMEIGASSAVQICLIMMPILVGFSAFVNHLNSANSFILVFPLFSVFAIIMSVIIVNYISIEGVTNYFKGASLTIIYILFVAAFFFSQHVTV